MKWITLPVSVLVLLSLGAGKATTAPAEPAASDESVREDIQQVWSDFVEVWEQGDASALASFYTPDAKNMPSPGSTQTGMAEIEALFTNLFASYTDDVLSQTTDEIFVHDGMAYELGVVEFKRTPKSEEGEPVVRRFRYVSLLKKQSDGSWKFHRWLGQPNR